VSKDGDVTLTPSDPQGGYDALPGGGRRRRVPVRFWLIAVLVAMLLVFTAGSGLRRWWADRLHDITGGSWPFDFAAGLVVGLLPLIGIALGSLHARGHRRVVRMLLLGAAGFCLTYLLSPSAVRIAFDTNATRVFSTRVPGYLPGVVTAEVGWLVVLAFAWWRLRQWRRTRLSGITRIEFRR
jgi:hypothetical protein